MWDLTLNQKQLFQLSELIFANIIYIALRVIFFFCMVLLLTKLLNLYYFKCPHSDNPGIQIYVSKIEALESTCLFVSLINKIIHFHFWGNFLILVKAMDHPLLI